MYMIDKQKFGMFVAQLRKEKGFTQKELAQRLFISDKAVSKWETGASIPDTALLIPLAEILGVSTTELLLSEKLKTEEPMDSEKVDGIVRTAIAYADESPELKASSRKKASALFAISALVGVIGLALCAVQGTISQAVIGSVVLGIVFGAYFSFCAQEKLPVYYDQHRISGVQHGAFRMNIPWISLNNSNWPHILRAGRIWACSTLALYPLLSALMLLLDPQWWLRWEKTLYLITVMGGLLLPICYVGKKYE